MKSPFLCLLLLVAFLCGDVSAFGEKPQSVLLIDSMIQRLEISKEVAWAKFQNHLPVADPTREAILLAGMTAEGIKLGLSKAQVTDFFQPQIMASRKVQEELIADWNAGKPMPTAPPKNLMSEIRPQVIRVSLELLREWKKMLSKPLPSELHHDAEEKIMHAGFSSEVAKIASSPLVVGVH